MSKLYGLTENTAERLKVLLGAGTGALATNAGIGRNRWVLARCTSGTAVGGSDVAAQCYESVMYDPRSNGVVQDEQGLPAYLTVMGQDGEPIAPSLGRVYIGLHTGYVTPGDVERPRVFAAAHGDEDGFGGGGVGRTFCAEYTTQNYSAVLDGVSGYPDAESGVFYRGHFFLDNINTDDGDPAYSYRIGRKRLSEKPGCHAVLYLNGVLAAAGAERLSNI